MGKSLPHTANRDRGLDEMLTRAPGFKGYDKQQTRRASDGAQRDALANRLVALKEPLDRMATQLMYCHRIDCLAQVDGVRKLIENEIGRIRFAACDYTPFYKAETVPAESIALIVEYDLNLHRCIDNLAQAVNGVTEQAHDLPKASWECKKIGASFRALDRALTQRQELLKGIS